MINKVILTGRITKDIELRKTTSGVSVVSFTLAVNRKFVSEDAKADFINCIAWRQSADFLHNYAKKGALLGVEGRIEVRSYENSKGEKVYATEVTCDSVEILHQAKDEPTPAKEETFTDTLDITGDDLPF